MSISLRDSYQRKLSLASLPTIRANREHQLALTSEGWTMSCSAEISNSLAVASRLSGDDIFGKEMERMLVSQIATSLARTILAGDGFVVVDHDVMGDKLTMRVDICVCPVSHI